MSKNPVNSAFLLGIFALLIAAMVHLYQNFLLNFFIALLLCIATFGAKKRLANRVGNGISSILLVAIFGMFLFAPVIFIFYKSIDLAREIDTQILVAFLRGVQQKILIFAEKFEPIKLQAKNLLSSLNLDDFVRQILNFSSFFATKSINFLTDSAFILIFMSIIFFYGATIYIYFLRLIPLRPRISDAVFREVSGVIQVVLFSSIVNIFLQGLAFFFAIFALGIENAALFGVLYGIFSLVPVIGGAIIWLPVACYLLYLERFLAAGFLAIYSAIFIGFFIDNCVKPLVIRFVSAHILKRRPRLNEIFIFFAILAGLSVFGFWGIVIGPALSAFFIAALSIYRRFFLKKFRF